MPRGEVLKGIFRNLRSSFVVIGLTGRLGAGVTTSGEIIKELFENPNEKQKFLSGIKCCNWLKEIDNLENLRVRRLELFWKDAEKEIDGKEKDENNFHKVKILKGRLILLLLLIWMIHQRNSLSLAENIVNFSESEEDFKKEGLVVNSEFTHTFIENVRKESSEIKHFLEKLFSYEYENLKDKEADKILEFAERINELGKRLSDGNRFKYIRFLQEAGRFLRSSEVNTNEVFGEKSDILSCFSIAETTRRLIKIYSKNFNLFVIDALRNNLEIEFFRNRYSNFYLFSILAQEETRKERLKKNGLSEDDIKKLSKIEKRKPSSENNLYEQNIEFCITKADIFIDNNINEVGFSRLKYQLLKYLTLIIHPGLVPPTKDEIFMQIAISARYASGCISRQVGAVVIGKEGYVRGIGWNNVPEGQTPCSLRDFKLLSENESHFSPYERRKLQELFENYKIRWREEFPFCFKELQNFNELKENIERIEKKLKKASEEKLREIFDEKKLKKIEVVHEVVHKEELKKILKELGEEIKDEIIKQVRDHIKAKNPSRERALHAEENAYLQAAKVGGVSVKGGTLYTTDFPCQLCSKKTVQLQISRVVYIEDYPDISKEHTLMSNSNIKVDYFKGAVREAYFKVYAPFIPLKDEIKFYLSSSEK